MPYSAAPHSAKSSPVRLCPKTVEFSFFDIRKAGHLFTRSPRDSVERALFDADHAVIVKMKTLADQISA